MTFRKASVHRILNPEKADESGGKAVRDQVMEALLEKSKEFIFSSK